MSCKIISCSNNVCVYLFKGKCCLKKTEINELGYCESFMVINIPEDIAAKYQKIHLQSLKQR